MDPLVVSSSAIEVKIVDLVPAIHLRETLSFRIRLLMSLSNSKFCTAKKRNFGFIRSQTFDVGRPLITHAITY
ncbi:hypothetical protein Plhal304r1_c029g0096111 [Plasmopara halstedii]